MNNKFIKTLIIINGILIPLFILTLFGILITEFITTRPGWHSNVNDDYKPEYVIEHTSPQEIVNSENYFVSKFKSEEINKILMETVVKIGDVPENTINIVFLNKDFEKIGNLLENDASIKHINFPNLFSNDNEQRELTQNITYLIAFEDSNNDNVIDRYDEHHLYISDLSGKNLNRILDKRIKEYKFINDFKEILVTYHENEKDLAVGVYDIGQNIFTKKSTLNFEN